MYVDATYNYGDTDLGAVMHDFICADPAAMRCPVLAERARYLKETEEGVREMDDVGDEIFREGMEAGLKEGREQGLEQGLEQGRDAAIAKLVADGRYRPKRSRPSLRRPLRRSRNARRRRGACRARRALLRGVPPRDRAHEAGLPERTSIIL